MELDATASPLPVVNDGLVEEVDRALRDALAPFAERGEEVQLAVGLALIAAGAEAALLMFGAEKRRQLYDALLANDEVDDVLAELESRGGEPE